MGVERAGDQPFLDRCRRCQTYVVVAEKGLSACACHPRSADVTSPWPDGEEPVPDDGSGGVW